MNYRLSILLLCLFMVSCVTTRTEMDTLSARVWDQDQQQRRLQGQLTALDQELTRLLTEMEGVSTPLRATQANLWAEVEALRIQTATMQGQMEELQRLLQGEGSGATGGHIADLGRQMAFLDRSVTMIASQLALDLGPRPGASIGGMAPMPDGAMDGPDQLVMVDPDVLMPGRPEPPAAPARTATADDPAQALYDLALQAFHERNYAQAQRMWQEFATTFPEHDLVSNALFWQGESFFQMQDYGQAILAYQDVISKHPGSNKFAASMLKQGASFFRLGKDRAGALVLEDLVDRFPDQPEAARAKNLLDEHRGR
ncbi:tol-pal system protein YbgF [Desulfonatronum thioautotrophicum]|uniref:tol-pal system protein YbgF n=1 Tax=Desulfonatronum thioautotrophicum TaxID=617001 RepID=UPI000699691A|nr:tol-pal system protein YbgF [Desulfonatronum thioautotrophicum]